MFKIQFSSASSLLPILISSCGYSQLHFVIQVLTNEFITTKRTKKNGAGLEMRRLHSSLPLGLKICWVTKLVTLSQSNLSHWQEHRVPHSEFYKIKKGYKYNNNKSQSVDNKETDEWQAPKLMHFCLKLKPMRLQQHFVSSQMLSLTVSHYIVQSQLL